MIPILYVYSVSLTVHCIIILFPFSSNLYSNKIVKPSFFFLSIFVHTYLWYFISFAGFFVVTCNSKLIFNFRLSCSRCVSQLLRDVCSLCSKYDGCWVRDASFSITSLFSRCAYFKRRKKKWNSKRIIGFLFSSQFSLSVSRRQPYEWT